MQPKHRFTETVSERPVEQPDPIQNGNKDNVLEMPRPLSEDQLLKDAMTLIIEGMAEDRAIRREDRDDRKHERAVTQALLTKIANGNGDKSKLQGWITPVAGALLIVFAGIAWFPKQETKVGSLEGEVSTLRRDLEQARQDIRIKQTYDERMRSNLRDLGISIDPETAEITVVVPRKIKK